MSLDSSISDDFSPRLSPNYRYLRHLEESVRLAKELSNSDDVLFGYELTDVLGETARLTATRLGRQLSRWLRQHTAYTQSFGACTGGPLWMQIHPWGRLMLDWAEPKLPVDGRETPSVEVLLTCKLLNAEVARLRARCRDRSFRDEVAAFDRHSRDSARSVKRYLRALSDRYAKLLVIRLDFGYRMMDEGILRTPSVEPSLLHAHRHLLLQFFAQQFAGVALGYVAKTEFGVFKGPHLHAIFVLDGSKVRRDISIAAVLGNYWNETVTGGSGTYFNCNRTKDRYRVAGIGMVDYRNPTDWLGAEVMVDYITKVDYFARAWADGDRTLVKGWTPRVRENPRGRPRTKRYKNILAGVKWRRRRIEFDNDAA